jgi:hypothetical protein
MKLPVRGMPWWALPLALLGEEPRTPLVDALAATFAALGMR